MFSLYYMPSPLLSSSQFCFPSKLTLLWPFINKYVCFLNSPLFPLIIWQKWYAVFSPGTASQAASTPEFWLITSPILGPTGTRGNYFSCVMSLFWDCHSFCVQNLVLLWGAHRAAILPSSTSCLCCLLI